MVTEVTVEQLTTQIQQAFAQVTLENGIGVYEGQGLKIMLKQQNWLSYAQKINEKTGN
ncbi:hypothetical protein VQ643_03990 [Pseudomonas sp. F1_0610]|uniref:hypothetical protein n=1 Tax=Pseudomonas sp. F1_0610 TaxID=3114284 RepID=UPI0039C2B747